MMRLDLKRAGRQICAKLGLAALMAVPLAGGLSTSASALTIGANESTSAQDQAPQDPVDSPDVDGKEKQKPAPPIEVALANGAIEFTASGTWQKVPPKSGMIEAEIKIPKLDEDAEDGRLTIMGAGGSIEANIERWRKQFVAEDGELVQAKREVKKIANQTVHLIDLTGTYLDSPAGPFAGGATIERENYRMLAAIIQTKGQGNYFVKLYGPKNTIDKNAEHFKTMIESLKADEADEADKE